MAPVLLKQTLRAGQAYVVRDVDYPERGALAAAVNGPDGWQVASANRVVGDRLDQRRAIALMMRTAIFAAGRATGPLLPAG
ncbi:hypothetical protein MED01_007043 [Micromonospora sp. MED01]|uniref:hypothetical protein n=1 Tax=Micromonospora alfalfae TaxID=2911212 RepID=UPI001EE98206|nr:hypothetical protein [Micromonospora alfalfae]MCG5462165.1 hypothetical protein [Micromonospora alfalfae]